jgi:hypothetical protein
VSPNTGGTNGHTTVTINGTGLTGASAVRFGGVDAMSYSVVSDSQISAVTPAHNSPTSVDVTVYVGGLSSTCGGCFTYKLGFWATNSAGAVVANGAAQDHGSYTGGPLSAPIVSMAATPSGSGYWLLGQDGGVFTFNVPYLGGGNQYENCRCFVAIAADYTGNGYWVMDNAGHIYSFGDAAYRGNGWSDQQPNPCNCFVAMTASRVGMGYWLLDSRGEVYSEGVPYHGNTTGTTIAIGITGTADDGGYWVTDRNGAVWHMGNASDYGGTNQVCGCVVGIAATPDSGGYWVPFSGGGMFEFGNATAVAGGNPAGISAIAALL